MTNVLIVDDSRFLRQTIADILKEQGIDYSECANGIEALNWLSDNQADCVLIDLMMPEMDGLDFLGQFRSNDETTPVIVITADIQATTKRKCMDAGATAVINKPADREELTQTIAAVTAS